MKIAIVGCGMGGMSSAIQLARDRHQVTIFEAFAQPKPLGAGLLLQPTGLEALQKLGLRSRIEEKGAEIDGLVGRRPDGRLIMDLRYAYGRTGDTGIGIHRGSLFNALYEAVLKAGVHVETGREVEAITDFETPVLQFADGDTSDSFDLVIVSDGAHSRLRAQIDPDAHAPEYPWGAVWTILPDTDGQWHEERWLAQVYSGTRIMIGVLPAGENPQHPEGPRCISFFWSLETRNVETWQNSGLTAFLDEVETFWPEARNLLNDVSSLENFAPAAYRDVRCRRWSRGRVMLIGDAAHGASPQLGQGANMAICDGVEIAAALKDETPSQAFVRYEKVRRPVLRYYTWMSWALTPVFQGHADWIGVIRDLVFGFMCRMPGVRNLMAWTLVGRGRWFW
ncbi:FAD-dependent oxidoreductase [Hyphobacterium sp.]|uniref:FAD-dependent oxidoreductase n=1 Tax=Hyphobacterium sp. TaxID=2004662 RepID=UPI003BABA8F8